MGERKWGRHRRLDRSVTEVLVINKPARIQVPTHTPRHARSPNPRGSSVQPGPAQPAPLDSPELGHHPHRLGLDHRGAPGLQFRAFFRKSTVRQCNTAPGRRRERSGARARAAPMGKGVGRVWRPPAPRVERARPTDPSSTSFDRSGPDKGPSTVQKRFSMIKHDGKGG